MNYGKKVGILLLLLCLAVFGLCACGTVTTEEAGEYLDEGEQTASSGGGSGECTVTIECLTILDHPEKLDPSKKELVPEDGILLAETTVAFEEGESVMDVLKKVTRDNKIQMEFEESPAYDGGYVEGIGNLYEFDCGAASGWEFFVNGWSPNYSAGNYIVSDGDVIAWRYTCDNGKDLE